MADRALSWGREAYGEWVEPSGEAWAAGMDRFAETSIEQIQSAWGDGVAALVGSVPHIPVFVAFAACAAALVVNLLCWRPLAESIRATHHAHP